MYTALHAERPSMREQAVFWLNGTLAAGLWGATVVLWKSGLSFPVTVTAAGFVLWLDLLVRSPCMAGCARVRRAQVNRAGGVIPALYTHFQKSAWSKAVRLRLLLWKKQGFAYSLALAPSAALRALSDTATAETYTAWRVCEMLGRLSIAWGIVGCGAVAVAAHRFDAAWYLLEDEPHAAGAPERSARLMKGHIGQAVAARFLGRYWGLSRARCLEQWREQSIWRGVYFRPPVSKL